MKVTVSHHSAILLSLFLCFLPHIAWLPTWLVGWCLLFWGVALYIDQKQLPQTPKLLNKCLAIIGFLGVCITYGRYSLDTCIALIAMGAGIMPLETKSLRDKIVVITNSYFLILTSLFYSNSLLMTLYLFSAVLISTATLTYVNNSANNLKLSVKFAGTMILFSMPLVVIVFLAFPRIQGGLWGLSSNRDGKTGFTDNFSPGDVSKLVQNTDVAFRATFNGELPEKNDLYWRGIVFNSFDGKKWKRNESRKTLRKYPRGEQTFEYDIILEPHFNHWLFALDLPYSISHRKSRILDDQTIYSKRPVTEKIQYRVSSLLAEERPGEPAYYKDSLALPRKGNPEARALAEGWMEDYPEDPRSIIEEARVFLSEGDFIYTLRPAEVGKHFVDDLLFGTKEGYCEHYASAFAFLMRAAGIPTRIIGGYVGGEINPLGNYLIVRQSDAHVWVEVWLDSIGWLRVDPTAAVSPQRISEGLTEAVAEEELPVFLLSNRFGGLVKYWRRISLGWDMINYRWTRWVMGYSQKSQRRLFKQLGIDLSSWRGKITATALSVGLVFVLLLSILWYLRNTEKKKVDQVALLYDQFLTKLQKAGHFKPANMGPLDFAKEVAKQQPEIEKQVNEVTKLYVQLRYSRAGSQLPVEYLKKKVNALTVK